MPTYAPKQAQDLLGASESALRSYTTTYARYLSTEATSTPRRFTEADLKTLAFVISRTRGQSQTHAQVLDALAAGELDEFAWELPVQDAPLQEEAEQSTMLVPMATRQAAQALLQDAQRREQESRERERELQARIEELKQDLGRTEGKLAMLEAQRRRPPAWWVKLFGGREG